MSNGLTLEELKARGAKPVKTSGGLSLDELKSRNFTANNQFDVEKGFFGKAGDFVTDIIGGKHLAQGLGKAIASKGILDDVDKRNEEINRQQKELLRQINEKRAKGEDVSGLLEALKLTGKAARQNADVAGDFESSLPTNKQVIGSSVKLGATIGLGALGKGLQAGRFTPAVKGLDSVFKVGSATTKLGGFARGAGLGASTGLVEGFAHGAGEGLEDNKDAKGVAVDAVKGGGIGALFGGAVGGIAGGISGHIKGRDLRRAASKVDDATDIVSPKLTQKVKAEAAKSGRFEDAGLFKKGRVLPDARQARMAEAVADIVDTGNSPAQNIDNVRFKVDDINKNVKSYIKANKVPFNRNQLRAQLNSGKADLELVFASDKTAERTYDAVVDAFMKEVGDGDTLGAFTARQDFDRLPAIKKLLETDTLGENARREIVLSVRGAANNYISSLLPKNNPYRNLLLREHYMLEALENMADKAASRIGKNKLQLMIKEYPIIRWLGGGAVGAGTGVALFGD